MAPLKHMTVTVTETVFQERPFPLIAPLEASVRDQVSSTIGRLPGLIFARFAG